MNYKGFMPYADMHLGSNYALGSESDLRKEAPAGYMKVGLGDIFDRTGCYKKNLKEVNEAYYSFMIECRSKLGFYSTWNGNHEGPLDFFGMRYYEPSPGVLYIFKHLDGIIWGFSKSYDFRSKKLGSSFIKWKYLAPWYNELRKLKKVKIKDEAMKSAIEVANSVECANRKKYKKIVIVGGHSHPKEIVKRTEGKVTLMILPRCNGNILVDFELE